MDLSWASTRKTGPRGMPGLAMGYSTHWHIREPPLGTNSVGALRSQPNNGQPQGTPRGHLVQPWGACYGTGLPKVLTACRERQDTGMHRKQDS